MRAAKATKSQVRLHNRQLVMRAVYNGIASNRAALAQETGLTKPTISDLVAELIDDGLLVEEGFGESSTIGGKRPILLRFVPDARQVIGVSMNGTLIRGMLTNLDGRIIAEHYTEIPQNEDLNQVLIETINGLVAQVSAPLLCLGVGISPVDSDMPRNLQPNELANRLQGYYRIPAYVFNNSELAVMAQAAFGNLENVERLATVLIGQNVGVGLLLAHLSYQIGGELDLLHVSPFSGDNLSDAQPIRHYLAWSHVKQRTAELGKYYNSPYLQEKRLTYLHIRQAAANEDQAALQLQEELAFYLAQIFTWIIALVRPTHISLVGMIADLGEPFLEQVIDCTEALLPSDQVRQVIFSVDATPNLVVMGVAAKAVRSELGLV